MNVLAYCREILKLRNQKTSPPGFGWTEHLNMLQISRIIPFTEHLHQNHYRMNDHKRRRISHTTYAEINLDEFTMHTDLAKDQRYISSF